MQLAGIKGLNYRQLRRLFRIVKDADAEPRRWVHFTFRDVVALKVAYELARGKTTEHRNVRLHFAQVEQALATLRRIYRISDPLTQVRLKWEGSNVVASFEGVHFEAASGQLLLVADVINKKAKKVAWLRSGDRVELRSQLKAELADLKEGAAADTCVARRLFAKARLG